jgi:TonB family protein
LREAAHREFFDLRVVLVPLVLLLAGASVISGLPQTDSRVCGRVETVTCAGPGSPATMQLTVPSGRLLKRSRIFEIVVPASYRGAFGMRIEDAFEEQSVCVADSTSAEAGGTVTIERPDQLTVAEPRHASATYPPGIFRSCDAGVQPPVSIREGKPAWPGGRAAGTVVLRAVVDPSGGVRDLRVVRSVDPGMDAAVRNAVREWRFRPGALKGAPVPVVVTVELTLTRQ